ncbi:unnamed protein product [Owenia fusiformis]|uniref:adenylate cyclase n=1 Tax=Owenia fusiformis TaxID=6347 RepID=A0A8S4P684_OWEFU|nr:unnamed protein product [Owenia fusiformis]
MEEAEDLERNAKGWRGCAALTQKYYFSDPELEALYERYIFKLQKSTVQYLLVLFIILSAVLAVLDFVHALSATVDAVFYFVQCAIFILLFVFINTRFMKENYLRVLCYVILFLCASFVIVALPINFGDRPDSETKYSPAEGVWNVIFVVFLMYAMLPVKLWVLGPLCLALSILHIVISAIYANTFPDFSGLLWRQLIANAVLFGAANIAGLFIHCMTERAQRKAFVETRTFISARLEVEDYEDRIDGLLQSLLPQQLAADVKEDMLSSDNAVFPEPYLQKHNSVSVLFADIAGFSTLASQCTAQELVRIVNELFGKFDQLAVENHCLRVKLLGDGYFCVSGLPDPRPDHAKCCVDLGLDLIEAISAIKGTTEVPINLRVGVHTGSVVSGIMGQKRWHYDVWGNDVLLANQIQASGTHGRVHISKVTLDHLDGEFEVDTTSNWERNQILKESNLQTFLVKMDPQRRNRSLLHRHFRQHEPTAKANAVPSFNSVSSSLIQLMHSMRFNADVPFASIMATQNEDKYSQLFSTKSTDSYRKQNKKRQTTDQSTNRVNKYLAQAISIGSIGTAMSHHANVVTLRFKSEVREKRYSTTKDNTFPCSMVCTLLLLICLAVMQAVILPRTVLLLLLFLAAFCWISLMLILVMGAKIKCISCDLRKSPVIRLVVVTTTLILVYAVGLVNVLCCKEGFLYSLLAISQEEINYHLSCEMPQYIYISGILGCITVAVFVKLPSLVKVVLMIVMVIVYSIVVEVIHPQLFVSHDTLTKADVPTHLSGVLALFLVLLALFLHGRQIEWIYRLEFMWKAQATDERTELDDLKNYNRQILCNMVPTHVAIQYIDNRLQTDLHSHFYSTVAVMFASVSNFSGYYQELSNHGQAVECGKRLNDIIIEFDELLLDDRFRAINKMKSHGTSYMTALGLRPELQIQDTDESIIHHLNILVYFVFAMKEKIARINEEALANFTLRVGISFGPVTAGVAGSKKPQYDIYGNTVNIASKLETTGRSDCIQVTEDVYRALKSRYQFQCRGKINLRGKGDIITYFLIGPKSPTKASSPGLEYNGWNRRPSNDSRDAFPLPSPTSTNGKQGSRENIHIMTGASNKYRKTSVDSLKGFTGTPPSSGKMSRRRQNSGDQGPRDNAKRLSSSSISNLFLRPPDVPYQRVASPDLPAVHYMNTNINQNNDSLPRKEYELTLTQSTFFKTDKPQSPETEQLLGRTNDTGMNANMDRREHIDNATKYSLNNLGSITNTPSHVNMMQNITVEPQRSLTRRNQGASTNSSSVRSPHEPHIVYVGAEPIDLNQEPTSHQQEDIDPDMNHEINAMEDMLHEFERNNKVLKGDKRSAKAEHVQKLTHSGSGNGTPLGVTIDGKTMSFPGPNDSVSQQNNDMIHNNTSITTKIVPGLKQFDNKFNQKVPVDIKPKAAQVNHRGATTDNKWTAQKSGDSNSTSDHVMSDYDHCMSECWSETDGGTSTSGLDEKSKAKFEHQLHNHHHKHADRGNNVNHTNLNNTNNAAKPKDLQLKYIKEEKPRPVLSIPKPPTPVGHNYERIAQYVKDHQKQQESPIVEPVKLNLYPSPSPISVTPENTLNLIADDGVDKGEQETKKPPLPRQMSCPDTKVSAQIVNPLEYNTLPSHLKNIAESPGLSSNSPVSISSSSPNSLTTTTNCPMVASSPDQNPIGQKSRSTLSDIVQQVSPPPLPPPPENGSSSPPTSTFTSSPSSSKQSSPKEALTPLLPDSPQAMMDKGTSPASMFNSSPNPDANLNRSRVQALPLKDNVESSTDFDDDDDDDTPLQSKDFNKVGEERPTPNIMPPSAVDADAQIDAAIQQIQSVSALMTSSKNEIKPYISHDAPWQNSSIYQNGFPNSGHSHQRRSSGHSSQLKHSKSLEYLPSDGDTCDEAYADVSSQSSMDGGSPKIPSSPSPTTHRKSGAFYPIPPHIRKYLVADNISLSSIGSSDMSKSDPAINYDSGSNAYESEYDNYRPGMASDEDYFVPEPISDIEIDAFDDKSVNVDNVTVSDTFSLDMPLPKIMHKRVTDV